jgi:hypothetical protein
MHHRGSCLCGAVTFAVEGPLRAAIACHCRQCRKGSGHYSVATAAMPERVSIEGTVTWYRYSDAAERGFCATCGGQLFWRSAAWPHLSIWAGAFDGDTDFVLAGHIYTGEKGNYYGIDDGLPSTLGGTFDQRGLTA